MEKGFVDVIQFRILRWEDYPGLSGWAQQNQESFKRKTGGSSHGKDLMMEAEVGVMV